ncbi:hypothetical protein HYT53_03495 [Candidatus Woesearchaeota archaeon]|nr:hypothetical protein [Candidatus Woesearchaeota archaeon]
MTKRKALWIDKTEESLLAKIKQKSPTYADLETVDIAHLELKTRLIEVLKSL